MRQLLAVPKSELDQSVWTAKAKSSPHGPAIQTLLGVRNPVSDMRILILVFALAISVAAQSQPPTPAQRSRSSQNDKGKSAPHKAVAKDNKSYADSTAPAVDQPTPNKEAREERSNSTPERSTTSIPGWLKASTIVSAGAAFFIAILAGIQAWLMHRQRSAMEQQTGYMHDALVETRRSAGAAETSAEAARASAEAAKRSADSLRDIERAWLVFRLENTTGSALQAEARITNCGRTPAWITEIGITYRKLTMPLEKPPETFIPDVMRWDNGTLIPASVDSKVMSSKLDGTGLLTETEYQRVRDDRLFLIFLGVVKYTDIFGGERETRTCQRFIPNLGWALHGPPELNRRT